MGSSSAPAMPEPINYTPALIQMSQDRLTAMQAQISAQMLAQSQNFMNTQLSIMSNMVTQLEGLDTKMQIARLHFIEAEDKIDLKFEEAKMRHEEKLAEIELRREMDEADDHEHGDAGISTISRSGWNQDFRNWMNDPGGYTPPSPSDMTPGDEEVPT